MLQRRLRLHPRRRAPPISRALPLRLPLPRQPTMACPRVSVPITGEVKDEYRSILRRTRKQLLRKIDPDLVEAYNNFAKAVNENGSVDIVQNLADDMGDAYDDARRSSLKSSASLTRVLWILQSTPVLACGAQFTVRLCSRFTIGSCCRATRQSNPCKVRAIGRRAHPDLPSPRSPT